jgi:NAD(P)H dehydrogenase (quinone)
MILVTGAGGKTGKAVIAALLARGAVVRGFVRSPAYEPALKAIGASEVVVGTMDDADALSRAVRGVDALYHICPNVNPNEIVFAKMLIAAGTSSGTSRLVYHSVLHPQIEEMPHHWNKLRVEEMLLSSGLDFTILQPTAYMQNSVAQWDAIKRDGVFRVPYPVETRLSLVDLDDVAEAAALVLTNTGHSNATYELAGTPPLSQLELAEAFGRALKTHIRAEAEPIESWNHRARSAGMDDYQRETLIMMFRVYARVGLKGNCNVLGWLLGRLPTSLAAFAARIAALQA